MKARCVGILFLAGTIAFAQATIRQLMLDLIYPSSNEILLAIYRGGPPDKPKDEKEWAAVRRADAGGIRKHVDHARPRARSRGLDEGREIAGGRRKRRIQSGAGQGRKRARGAGRNSRCKLHHVPQTIPAERVSEGRR